MAKVTIEVPMFTFTINVLDEKLVDGEVLNYVDKSELADAAADALSYARIVSTVRETED